MDSAGAALGHAAAIFRARHSQMVAQHPQQRRRWVGVDALVLPVDRQIVWHLINPEVTVKYDIDTIDLICQIRCCQDRLSGGRTDARRTSLDLARSSGVPLEPRSGFPTGSCPSGPEMEVRCRKGLVRHATGAQGIAGLRASGPPVWGRQSEGRVWTSLSTAFGFFEPNTAHEL